MIFRHETNAEGFGASLLPPASDVQAEQTEIAALGGRSINLDNSIAL
jgi:hypothetical protein